MNGCFETGRDGRRLPGQPADVLRPRPGSGQIIGKAREAEGCRAPAQTVKQFGTLLGRMGRQAVDRFRQLGTQSQQVEIAEQGKQFTYAALIDLCHRTKAT